MTPIRPLLPPLTRYRAQRWIVLRLRGGSRRINKEAPLPRRRSVPLTRDGDIVNEPPGAASGEKDTAPELRKTKFEGAIVERVRPDAGLAPQGGPGSVRIPAQPRSQTAQTPNPGAQIKPGIGTKHSQVGLAG